MTQELIQTRKIMLELLHWVTVLSLICYTNCLYVLEHFSNSGKEAEQTPNWFLGQRRGYTCFKTLL